MPACQLFEIGPWCWILVDLGVSRLSLCSVLIGFDGITLQVHEQLRERPAVLGLRLPTPHRLPQLALRYDVSSSVTRWSLEKSPVSFAVTSATNIVTFLHSFHI